MKIKPFQIILFLWCSFFCTDPTYASIEGDSSLPKMWVSVSKDTLNHPKKDSTITNNGQPATRTLSDVEVNPLLARWQKEKATKAEAPTILADKKFKSFPELDSYTKNLYVPPSDGKAEFTPLARASRSCRPE